MVVLFASRLSPYCRRMEVSLMELNTPDSPKMLRETLCEAQTFIGQWMPSNYQSHLDRLQRLINECDRHRPLGPDGKHGNRHTPTCGCEDKQDEQL